MGRPKKKRPHGHHKMQEWIIGLKKVIAEEQIEFLSDDDLFMLVNHRLNKKNRIAKRTFDYWKAGKYAPEDNIGEEFMTLIKIARIKQKQALGAKMFEETNMSWTKYAWLLERKFEELNLKRVSENVNKNETTTIIQISAANDEQKALIDNIINIDFEDVTKYSNDVEPQFLPLKIDNKEDDEELPF